MKKDKKSRKVTETKRHRERVPEFDRIFFGIFMVILLSFWVLYFGATHTEHTRDAQQDIDAITGFAAQDAEPGLGAITGMTSSSTTTKYTACEDKSRWPGDNVMIIEDRKCPEGSTAIEDLTNVEASDLEKEYGDDWRDLRDDGMQITNEDLDINAEGYSFTKGSISMTADDDSTMNEGVNVRSSYGSDDVTYIVPGDGGETRYVREKTGLITGLIGDDYKYYKEVQGEDGKTKRVEVKKTEFMKATGIEKKELEAFGKEMDGYQEKKEQASEATRKKFGSTFAQRQSVRNAWNRLVGMGRSKLSQILNAYMDDWLGKYTHGVPAAVCGDSLYKKEAEGEDKEIAGVKVPSNTLESQMEKDMLEDIGTVILEGEKTEVSEDIYRYGVTIKLIGSEEKEWKLYLYNSCTEEDSFAEAQKSGGKRGWYEYGSISDQQFFGSHYAFTLDCTEGGNCRYDQACYSEMESIDTESGTDEDSGQKKTGTCVSLVHGGGFTSKGSTGKTSC